MKHSQMNESLMIKGKLKLFIKTKGKSNQV